MPLPIDLKDPLYVLGSFENVWLSAWWVGASLERLQRVQEQRRRFLAARPGSFALPASLYHEAARFKGLFQAGY